MNFNAFAAAEASAQFAPFAYPPKPLSHLDLEIEITHCGICHSDVHLWQNDWGITHFPFVPGHEIVEIVQKRGKNAKQFEIGDRVGVGWQCGSCHKCEFCDRGEENLCDRKKATCVKNHGGFADKIRVDHRFAFKIPGALSSAGAAPLLCGGITVYTPLRDFGVSSEMKVGVVGVGGLGHLAIQFAGAMGCEVTAFSTSPNKESEAKKFGAHHFVDSRNREKMKKTQRSLDFILTTVFADLDWRVYVNALRPRGKLCFVGVPEQPITISPSQLIEGQRSICGSPIGGRVMMQEMLQFAARHKIEAQIETLPFSEVNAAMAKVRDSQARYRVVLKN